MPVTTSVHTGPLGGGFRAWVHVHYDNAVAPTGYDVLLMWDPDEAVFQSIPGSTPRPSWVDAGDGVAVWVDVDLDDGQDFELHFTCASGFSGTTTLVGLALKEEAFDAAKSSGDYDCGGN